MDAATLREAMTPTGITLARAQELLPHFENAMRAADINNVERAAMWCAQIGHESAGLRYMEEIASGDAYEWRQDLGNIYPGDGRRFKGSGPIQLTGRHNFRAFTAWAKREGHSNIDFEAQPHLVRENPKWGFLAASWYWVVARPQINAMSDARNLEGVTRAINGGTNGLADRRARYNRCLALGSRLLPGKGEPVKIYHPMKAGTYRVSSGYGNRWGGFHAGLDFAADIGTPIYAPADGVVIEGRERTNVAGFGRWVWLDCQASVGRDFIFGHVHPSGIKVSGGQRVKAGDLIAEVGNEGQSTGPHLHFEVWGPPGRLGGRHEDPAVWLDKHVNNGETEDFLMALTDEEQRRLLENTDYIRGQLGPWPQLGHNEKGEPLTLVDALSVVKDWVEYVFHQLRPWKQLGQTKDGQDLTPVDGLSAARHDIAGVRSLIEGLINTVTKGSSR